MADLDTLRPEVREAIDCAVSFVLPSGATGTESDGRSWLQTKDRNGVHISSTGWTVIRAELLRLAKENTSRHANTNEAIDLMGTWINRAEKAEAELAALKAAGRFAVGVMDAFWSPPDVGSLDGFDLQELAEKHEMLTRFEVPEGGCGEACNCICEGAEPGDDCYRWSETFKRVRTGVEE